MSEVSDIRGVLLAALQMGEREAEHLGGLALARRLAAAHRAALDRLQAASYEAQRLACDKQELLSGEALDYLHEQLAAAEAEVGRLRAAVNRLVLAAGGTLVTDGDTTCTLGWWAARVLEAGCPGQVGVGVPPTPVADNHATDGAGSAATRGRVVQVTDDDGEAD